MTETERQPNGQWCWCPEPPEGQLPHCCEEDHARRGPCRADGAHVHPWSTRQTARLPRRYSFTHDELAEALTHLEAYPATTGPGQRVFINAESMADALIEALEGNHG